MIRARYSRNKAPRFYYPDGRRHFTPRQLNAMTKTQRRDVFSRVTP